MQFGVEPSMDWCVTMTRMPHFQPHPAPLRFGILGVSDIDVRFALAIILLFIAVLFVCSLWLLYWGTGIRN